MKIEENVMSQLEDLINKTYSSVEVVKNSCYYQDDYSGGDVLENANNYLDQIRDILDNMEVIS